MNTYSQTLYKVKKTKSGSGEISQGQGFTRWNAVVKTNVGGRHPKPELLNEHVEGWNVVFVRQANSRIKTRSTRQLHTSASFRHVQTAYAASFSRRSWYASMMSYRLHFCRLSVTSSPQGHTPDLYSTLSELSPSMMSVSSTIFKPLVHCVVYCWERVIIGEIVWITRKWWFMLNIYLQR